MSKCECITLKGTRCTRNAITNSKFCRQHKNCGEKKVNHPSFSEMIIKSIYAVLPYEKKGGTRQYIKKYLEANYNIEPSNPHINKAISKLIETEEIIVNPKYGGHYKLSSNTRKRLIKNE